MRAKKLQRLKTLVSPNLIVLKRQPFPYILA